MIPVLYIPLHLSLDKRGGTQMGIVYCNRKLDKTLVKILLYNSIFDRLRTFEWYLIFHYILQKWESLQEIEKYSFVALLSLSCEKRRLSLDWESYLRKTLSRVKKYTREDNFGRKVPFLDFLLSENLIVKDTSLITSFRTTYKPYKIPTSKTWMGKGYTDQGYSDLKLGTPQSADTRLLMQRSDFSHSETSSHSELHSFEEILSGWQSFLGISWDGSDPS